MTTANEKREYVPERLHATLTPAKSLKIARELQGLSQSELARQSGIPQSAISAFESGEEDMGIKRIKILAAALKVHPAVLAFPTWEAEVIDINQHIRRRTSEQTHRPPEYSVTRAGGTKRAKRAKTKSASAARPRGKRR
jgi:transcriptional regulator with XRE-family HTH domain